MATLKPGTRIRRDLTAGYRPGEFATIVDVEQSRPGSTTYKVRLENGNVNKWNSDYFHVVGDLYDGPVPAHKLNDGARLPSNLPNDSAERKKYPLHGALFGQFGAALVAVAHHSYKGNEKHNPGMPLQDNRSKSLDDEDCILRHLMEGDYEGVAWRALRLLQRKLEAEGAPVAPLATNLPTA